MDADEPTRVMLDIETLGRTPGCVVVSVGAVEFTTGGLGEEFSWSVSLESCADHGLSIEAETLEWWLGQDTNARAELQGGDDLVDVLEAFGAFYGDTEELWANSPAFDCAILGAAYDAVGWPTPWEFWQTRDYRTLKNLPQSPPEDAETAHRALEDAKRQARCAARTLDTLHERPDA